MSGPSDMQHPSQDDRFGIGYLYGQHEHRIKMLETKIEGWERHMKRGLIVFLLSIAGSVLNLYPGAPAKILASALDHLRQSLIGS